MSEALVVSGGALTAADLRQQVNLIQHVMKDVMQDGVHYGVVPGTDKPSLLKAGAEKLCMTFRLGPEYEVVEKEREGDHLTITARCTLTHIPSGMKFGSALGSCSTMESKYAYRKSSRVCPNCGAEAIIKGKKEYGGGWLCYGKKGGCGAKFRDGDESIESQDGGRVANEDKADQYNTVLKMACKRALLAAVLNATAASDIFSQDLLDDTDSGPVVTAAGEDAAARGQSKPRAVRQPARKAAPEQPAGEQKPGAINPTQARMLRSKLEKSGVEESVLTAHFKVGTIEEIPAGAINEALGIAEGA